MSERDMKCMEIVCDELCKYPEVCDEGEFEDRCANCCLAAFLEGGA